MVVAIGGCGEKQRAGSGNDALIPDDATAEPPGDAPADVTDGPADAATEPPQDGPDVPPAPVTVHVMGRGTVGPRAGLPVLFHAPDGTLSGRTETDAQGDASGTVGNGGSVTVVEPGLGGLQTHLTTIVGVTGGEAYTIGEVGFLLPPIGHLSITVPPAPGDIDRYQLSAPCLSSDFLPSPVDTITWSCVPSVGSVLVAGYRRRGTIGLTLRGFLFATNVALQDGGTPTLTGTWQPAIDFLIDVTMPPDILGGLFVFRRVFDGGWSNPIHTGTLQWAGGALTMSIPLPGGGDGALTELAFDRAGPVAQSRNVILEYRTGEPTTLTGDISSDLISQPLDVQWVRGEMFPGGPRGIRAARWTMSGSGDHDGIVLEMGVVNPAFDQFKWKVVLPPGPAGLTEYALPRLPPDLVELWANNEIDELQVMVADTPATSYAEFRRDAVTESDWSWMRAPTQPRKVRIGTHTGSSLAPESATGASGCSRKIEGCVERGSLAGREGVAAEPRVRRLPRRR